MKRWIGTAAAAALVVAALGLVMMQPAAAQMADALGKPLQVPDLDVGTVTVRVVDGSPTKPLVGINVQLVNPEAPDGTARTARTDAAGRATFTRLAPGARYLARASAGEDDPAQGEQGEAQMAASEPFEVPASGGLRLMISTGPWELGPGAGAAGMPGMPDPRQMSGISRPQRGDPPGQLTIRVVQGQMSANATNHPVHLVGYGADGSSFVHTKNTDAGGRAVFEGLTANRVAYYAMTVLPRQTRGGQTIHDRVRSGVVIMPPEVGLRLMLAGETATSGAPPVEDLDRIELQSPAVAPGEVVVRLYGQVDSVGEVELVRLRDQGTASGGDVVATATVGPAAPQELSGSVGDAMPMADLADRSVAVTVVRSIQGGGQPVARARIDIEPVPAPGDDAAAAQAEAVPPEITGPQGVALVAGLTPGKQYRLVATVHGERLQGAPFTMPQSGGMRLPVNVAWRDLGNAEARFLGVPASPDGVYVTRARAGEQSYLSAPFQATPERGAALRMVVVSAVDEPVGFAFHMQGWVDDVYMGFQSQMTLHNWSYAPWDPGPEGLVMPLPVGFVGAQVEEEMSHKVSVDPDRGFIWRGAVPPGGARFMTAFSLPVNGGGISFDMPLPLGAMNSLLALSHTPGMEVDVPPGSEGRFMEDNGGRRHYVVGGINIAPMKRMVLSVSGLPTRPAWQRYLAWSVGVAVLCMLAWGLFGVFAQRRRDTRAAMAGARDEQAAAQRGKLKQRREHLLDELVTLEAKKSDLAEDEYQKRRGKLTRQLETVYIELEQARARGLAGPPA